MKQIRTQDRSARAAVGLILAAALVAVSPGYGYGQTSPDARYFEPMSATPIQDTVSRAREYEVGVNDLLDISILKPEEIRSTLTVAVAPDGAITVPYIGNVQANGRTLPVIQDEVQKRLADGYVEFPVVSVSLRQTRSKKFTVYGQVVHPGAYPAEEHMPLLNAITVAGGLIVPGSKGQVKLLRPHPEGGEVEILETDISDILMGAHQDVHVLSGDSIVVTVARFFVYGQIARPGAYPVEENMSILHAITVAGGFVESGATGRIKLLRRQGAKEEFEVLESDITAILEGAHQDIYVLPFDTIVVSVDKFFLYGEVNRPGMYPLEKTTTPLTAIAMAGGFVQSGATGRIKLLRSNTQGEEFHILESNVSAMLDGTSQEMAIHPGDTLVVSADRYFVSGDVVRPGAYPVEENMTLLHAVSASGGFIESDATGSVKLLRQGDSNEDFQIIDSDITAILSGAHRDVKVLPGDSIVVSVDKFFVYGEVNRPGMYPLSKTTTPLTAIAMAGGFTKFGSASHVKLLRMNEKLGMYDTKSVNIKDVISGYSKADSLLHSGDVVVVSESAF